MDDGQALRRRLRAVERTPAGHRHRTRRVNNLGATWRERIAASGDSTELDQAISYFRAARAATGAEGDGADSALAATEHILAVLLSDRYDILGQVSDLTAATDAAQRALEAVPAGSGDRPGYLAMLAVCQWEWFDATGSFADLERALATAEEAVSGLAPGSPLWARLHSNRGMLHLVRYERMGAADDLDRGIESVGVAVETVRPGDPERPGFYANLASALRVRFERQVGGRGDPFPPDTIDLEDLDAAISLYGLALSEPDTGLVDRAMILSNMGDALLDRAALHRLVEEDDKAETVYSRALAVHREAVAATSRTAPGAYAAVQSGDLRGAVVRMEQGRAILLADDLGAVPTALARLPDDDLARRYRAAARRLPSL